MIPAALADYTTVVDSAALVDSPPRRPSWPARHTTRCYRPSRALARPPSPNASPRGARTAPAASSAPRHLVAAGELFEAVGRPDRRPPRLRLASRPWPALYATNGVPLATEPALFAADRGDAAQALRLAEAGLRTGPTPAAQDAYAWALMANGRAAEAVTWADGRLRQARATPCSPSTAA